MYINSAQDSEDEDVYLEYTFVESIQQATWGSIFSLAKQADEVLNRKLPKSPHRYLAVDFVPPILSCCLMSMFLMSIPAKSQSQ